MGRCTIAIAIGDIPGCSAALAALIDAIEEPSSGTLMSTRPRTEPRHRPVLSRIERVLAHHQHGSSRVIEWSGRSKARRAGPGASAGASGARSPSPGHPKSSFSS
jgi:hypothetical protein